MPVSAARRSALARRRCAVSVVSMPTSALPTVGRRAAAAIASSRVDLPDPFSNDEVRYFFKPTWRFEFAGASI